MTRSRAPSLPDRLQVPHDPEAEDDVLGAALLSPEACRAAVERLRPDDFLKADARIVFEAISRLEEAGDSVDHLTVKDELRRTGFLDSLRDGPLYIAELTERVPVPANFASYVRIVADQGWRRRMVAGAIRLVEAASNGQGADAVLADLAALSDLGPAIDPSGRASALDVIGVHELLERVERAPTSWLIEGLWPIDAYGVLGAEDKAGKTWAVLDLAVSVASGTPWLGHYPCPEPGGVLLLLGEGGERAMERRLRAVADARGSRLVDLEGRLHISFSVPRLSDTQDLAALRRELSSRPTQLVVLDPLYLAAAGAKGSDLYAMGEVLGGIQRICQEVGSALLVTTHWNKTGEGGGAKRFTGVGPGAWGRVLMSVAVEQKTTEPDGTEVASLRWEVTGSEVAQTAFRVRRRIRAEDAADLSSNIRYEVEVGDAADLVPSQSRVLEALGSGDQLTVRELGDRLAKDGQGKPLTKRTIQRALKELAELHLADGEQETSGTAGRWWRTDISA